MPWRGPNEPGEYPTLGYDVGAWIEANVVVPDGYRKGERYLLTDEMWRFLIRFYRLFPEAQPWPAEDGLYYYGGQLRRSQKWGKDPFGAAIILAEALGPARFDGWNKYGEPVGAPYPTPYVPCLGTSEEQTDNTFKPLYHMIVEGPLANLPGMDPGLTRVELPGGGTIEPVTSSPRARLGQRMTFATLTETHLWTLTGGYRKLAGAVKRNIAGMDGRWLELTNAWDPTEGSEAQVTAEGGEARVLVDNRESIRVEDLRSDDEALQRELLRQYGDSARQRGGWVNISRIMSEVRSPRVLEADARRFFLNEIVVGESVFVDPIRWDLAARSDRLQAGDQIAVGFDGSKYQDATALVAARKDGRLFLLRVWERPSGAPAGWRVPSAEVDETVRNVFAAYRVTYMFADPYRWQDYLDTWSADLTANINGKTVERVVEFPTNVEQRMDRAIERFTTSFVGDEITHDGEPKLAEHMKNAVLVKGSKKKPRPGEDEGLATHYMKMAKRGDGMLIDLAVAGVLAYAARGQAIEDGLFDPVGVEVLTGDLMS